VREVWAAGRHILQGGRHFNEEQIAGRFFNTIKKLRKAL
jgi:hypothetical protein